MSEFYNSPGFGESSLFRNDASGTDIHRADRQPCPVCGHPTGDCVGDTPAPQTIWGYNTSSSLDDSLTFYIEEDYFEEREIAPGIITKILVFKKGKNIPLTTAKEYGFIK